MTLPKEGSEFTEYVDQGLTVEYRDASHKYWLHELVGGVPKRTPAISVTSALKVLDKPALMSWAEACGAEGAARLAELGELDVVAADAIYKVREFGLGMDAKRDAGAERGTLVHRVLEIYNREAKPPNVTDFELGVRGYVQGLCSWLLDFAPEPVATEVLVGSRLHNFAGRVDLYCSTKSSELELWDLKTSPRGIVYPEAHLQAAAYEGAGMECGFDPDRVFLLAVGEDGTYTVTHCHAELDDFLTVLEASRVMSRLRRATASKEPE